MTDTLRQPDEPSPAMSKSQDQNTGSGRTRPGHLFESIEAGKPFETALHPEMQSLDSVVEVNNFNLWYGKSQALFDVALTLPVGKVTALIGPSGCGKSTLLRSVNRMNDLVDGVRTQGNMTLMGEDIYAPGADVIELRKRIGMVFQKPNPFPMSIFENVVYSLRIAGISKRSILQEACEQSLQKAGLWEEVKDRLKSSALQMSGGQQQRLCIARGITAQPEVLLLDEPCSALDPIATGRIEDLINELQGEYSILMVTHNMQQASRVSAYTAFMYLGRLVEYGPTESIFMNPHLTETEDYVTGRFG